MEKTRQKKPYIVFVIPVLLLAAAAVALFFLLEGEKPVIEVSGLGKLIGSHQQLDFTASDQKSGIRQVEVAIHQGELRKPIFEQHFERQAYFRSAGPHRTGGRLEIDAAALGLKDGPAELVFTARDFSYWNLLRGNLTERVFPVTLDTQPPKLTTMESPQYITQGGAGIVIYKISEQATRHGAMINGFFHPGFALPGKDGVFGAIICLPYDTEQIKDAHVEAADAAGNIGKAPFAMFLKKGNFKHDTINVPDSFLELKIPEFSLHYPAMTGSALDKFLYINTKVREENIRKILEVCAKSSPERLWNGRFGRMPGSPKAGYADYRTYFYNGREVDQEVHLGVDIAQTQHTPVPAANKGKVVFADYLGIYGNMVILDHGLGVFSLYSHLSTIGVAKGDMVEAGGVLGATGNTGMAGGDHLHFGMLVNGIQVNPIEWWDEGWVGLHILNYLK